MTALNDLRDALPRPQCQCDRPWPTEDDDLGVICSRCGKPTDATHVPTSRVPAPIAAVLADAESRGQSWSVDGGGMAPAATTPAVKGPTLVERAVVVVQDLGEATSIDIASRLDVTPHRAGGILADAARSKRLARGGHRPSTNGGRPLSLYVLPDAPTGDGAPPPPTHDGDQELAADPPATPPAEATEADAVTAGELEPAPASLPDAEVGTGRRAEPGSSAVAAPAKPFPPERPTAGSDSASSDEVDESEPEDLEQGLAQAFDYIDRVFATMAEAQQHTFQVLTKRPERMLAYFEYAADFMALALGDLQPWPNIWLGVSIENRRFVGRAGVLRQVPAAVRFISAEPLLGPLVAHTEEAAHRDFGGHAQLDLTGIDWLIVGGESGARHRPMQPRWVRDLRAEAISVGVAFLFKQWGGATSKAGGRELDGRTWDQMPARPEAVPA